MHLMIEPSHFLNSKTNSSMTNRVLVPRLTIDVTRSVPRITLSSGLQSYRGQLAHMNSVRIDSNSSLDDIDLRRFVGFSVRSAFFWSIDRVLRCGHCTWRHFRQQKWRLRIILRLFAIRWISKCQTLLLLLLLFPSRLKNEPIKTQGMMLPPNFAIAVCGK